LGTAFAAIPSNIASIYQTFNGTAEIYAEWTQTDQVLGAKTKRPVELHRSYHLSLK
jgi:hypothetical protein